ncbi:DNA polymerase I [Streptomyces phage YDN12]|uniref:DNA polymerase I n=1 Tax=Streptomyces phage YDN12 TaxID=1636183 RepID=A0A0E3JTI2_9CAUD|nr:DNA polymerase I [Streptomyces phage YDN12]AKA61717.1 DNA polymerase I [Streptomyces phage YDN12]
MKVLAFDIETGAAEELHKYGPGFVRLCGWADVAPGSRVTISTDPRELTAALFRADALTAHNGINFDLMAMGREGFFTFDQYELLCRKMFDTMIVERHVNPVAAKGKQPMGYFGLDATAARYGLEGKSSVDFAGKVAIIRRVKGDAYADKAVKAEQAKQRKAARLGTEYADPQRTGVLKLLAELYGGYDRIPQDDPDYRSYLVADVQTQGRVFTKLASVVRDESSTSQRYVRREHYTATAMGRVTLEGMRTDVDETMKRWSEGQARLEAGKELLHEKFGMPTEGKYPHRSNPGKAAFRRAILATGISEDALTANWPMCEDGSLKTGKDVLDEFIPIFDRTKPAAAELCRTIKAFNGERTIYGTVLDHLVGDRVHPYIGPDQASGRWSMKDPGLTVFGKRGGKARERGIMLADSDDEVLVAIDADQVDARVIAAECQDSEYMKLFAPGMDLHSEVAFRVWPDLHKHGADCHREPKPDCHCGIVSKCHCELRDRAKVFGHGFSYGLGAAGMARQHGVDVAVAQGFVRGMTEAFPRLAEWKEEIRAAAGALGFDEPVPANDPYRILHTWAGRPVRVERDRAYTQATALVGQGGTRDVMAEAILRLPAEYRRKIRAVIHDEIVISLPKHNAQQVAQGITDSMAFDLRGVAITFGCSDVARSWAGCYGAQYETAA